MTSLRQMLRELEGPLAAKALGLIGALILLWLARYVVLALVTAVIIARLVRALKGVSHG